MALLDRLTTRAHNLDAFDLPLPNDAAHDRFLEDSDAMLSAQALDELLSRAKFCPAMNERHGRADFR